MLKSLSRRRGECNTAAMGYTNPDKRLVVVKRSRKKRIVRLRRLAEKRALRGEHLRGTVHASRRGYWYA